MKKSVVVSIVLSVLVLLVLNACGQQEPAPPAQPAAPPAAPAVPAEPARPAAPPQLTPPAAPSEEPVAVAGCPSIDRVKYWCKLDDQLTQGPGCTFDYPTTTDRKGGTIEVSVKAATEADYEAVSSAAGFVIETWELKPRAARVEKQGMTYFFWYTGSKLVSIKSPISLCTSDGLKRIAEETQSGVKSTIADFCGVSKKSACDIDTDCVAVGCSGNVCQAKSDPNTVSTCEFKECYVAKTYGLDCGCLNKQCQWR